MNKIKIALLLFFYISTTFKVTAQEKCYELNLPQLNYCNLLLGEITLSGNINALRSFLKSCDNYYSSDTWGDDATFLKNYNAVERTGYECLSSIQVTFKNSNEFAKAFKHFKEQKVNCQLIKNVCSNSKGTISYSIECENIGLVEFTFDGIKKISFTPFKGGEFSLDID